MATKRAGAVIVELILDDKKFLSGLNRIRSRIRNFQAAVGQLGRELTLLGTALTAPFLAASFQFAQYGDQLDKMAKRTGVASSELFKLDFVTSQFGANLISIQKGLEKLNGELQRTVIPAATVGALEQLGVAVDEIKGATGIRQILLLLTGQQRIQNATERLGLNRILLGRAGSDLATLAGRLDEVIRQLLLFESLGLEFGPTEQRAAANLKDAFNELRFVTRALTFAIGTVLADDLATVLRLTARVVKEFINWVRQNEKVIATVTLIGLKVFAVGAALIALSKVLTVINVLLGIMASLVIVFSTWSLLAGAVAVALLLILGYLFEIDRIGARAFEGVSAAFSTFFENLQKGATLATSFQILVNDLKRIWLDFLFEIQRNFFQVLQRITNTRIGQGALEQAQFIRDQVVGALQSANKSLQEQADAEAEQAKRELEEFQRLVSTGPLKPGPTPAVGAGPREIARSAFGTFFAGGTAALLRGAAVSPLDQQMLDANEEMVEKQDETNTLLNDQLQLMQGFGGFVPRFN